MERHQGFGFDNWYGRLLRLVYPLALYFAIGSILAVLLQGMGLWTNLAMNLAYGGVMAFLFYRDCQAVSEKRKRLVWWFWPVLLVSGAAASLALNFFLTLSGITGLLQSSYDSIVTQLYGAEELLLELLVMVAAAPIAEELLYRGILFRRMRGYAGFWTAALISSLLFGILHANWIQGLYGFLFGMLLAWVYERSRWILVPILFHAAGNLLSLLATEWEACRQLVSAVPVLSLLSGTVLLAGGLYLIGHLTREAVQKEAENKIRAEGSRSAETERKKKRQSKTK